MIKFGVAGIGGIKQIPDKLKGYNKKGIQAAEIPFTYQVWIKKKDTLKIKKISKKFKINLSIHAPYWINLNSEDLEKIKKSKERILKSCEIGHYLGAKKIVFHCGYYGKRDKKEGFRNIKKEILDMQETIKKNKWKVILCPEIIGKKNVFGGIEEISKLSKETKCGFCIDFAHVLARYGNYKIKEVKKSFPQKKWHCHFSGIEYGKQGEKRHKKTPEKEIKKLLSILPKNKEITIINESPSPIEDALLSLKIYKEFQK